MATEKQARKNPSRETCEGIIKRILITEVLEHGSNQHFRGAADFMNYFESLYPASDALTKQIQRAIKAMDMPKNEQGYFIVNKTSSQVEKEQELTKILSYGHAKIDSMEDCEVLFLSVDDSVKDYLIHLLENFESFQEKYVTIQKTNNGLLIYTRHKKQLSILLNSLTI